MQVTATLCVLFQLYRYVTLVESLSLGLVNENPSCSQGKTDKAILKVQFEEQLVLEKYIKDRETIFFSPSIKVAVK